jgi:predicted anti-sigma-YlaC factor YlaD
MECALIRQGLSAGMDGQPLPGGLTEEDIDAHVADCQDCRSWAGAADRLRARTRVAALPLVPDARVALLAGFDAARRRRTSTWGPATVRLALLVVAAVQLVVTVPVLLLGHDREAPVHVAHEMGSFELAVALGVMVAVWRPIWAGGMAWVVAGASILLSVTAAADLASGTTTWSDEAPHLLVIVAAVLLILLARQNEQRQPHIGVPAHVEYRDDPGLDRVVTQLHRRPAWARAWWPRRAQVRTPARARERAA